MFASRIIATARAGARAHTWQRFSRLLSTATMDASSTTTPTTISRLHSRQIFDSRGNPTLEVECHLTDGSVHRAAVPSGASTGAYEAHEMRDGGAAFGGKGVTTAIGNVNGVISAALVGKDASDLLNIDDCLLELDGTE
jgi:enolase